MAFQTGSQINPALGRVDYTPYMQGAVAGAQSIGQGIASLGQSIGSGMEAYAKRKKENKMMEASLKANINSLEGLSKIASSLSPQAQEHFNRTMQQLNNPSIPLTEKVVLAESAQKTVGELINFGMQEKQKQEQATIQQLGYDAAISGLPIPLIYPQSVRAPAAIQALAIKNQLANIAETKAKTAAAGIVKQPDLSFQEQRVQAEVNAFTKQTGKLPNEQEMAQIMDKVARGSVAQPEDPDLKLRVESFGKEVDTLIEGGRVARQVAPQVETLLTLINSGKLDTGALEDLKRSGRSFAKAVGFPVDEEKLASAEQARAMFGRMILEYFQQTKGSISNAENQLFQSFGPELGKSEAANKAILSAAKKRLELDRDLEKIARDFRMEKFNRIKAQELIQSKLSKYDEDLTSMLPSAPAPAGGGINLSPAALQFIPR